MFWVVVIDMMKKYLQRGQPKVHEYLRDTRYTYCNSCKNRTQFACIKCGFCWSCHWLKEKIERISPYMVPIEV
jgi:anaerobic ribonucleoside-triphosphate reductase